MEGNVSQQAGRRLNPRLQWFVDGILSALESRWLLTALLMFGALLRAREYFLNSALYVDEGALALNITGKSFSGLLGPLDFGQAAPPGFLMLEKVAVMAIGNSEYALRLFPFLFSIIALLAFCAAARRVLAAWAVPCALLFFAVSEQLIYFAAQVKQYSSDAAATAVIILVGLAIESGELTYRRAMLFSAFGAAVVWFSHPAVFVLAGIGSTLALVATKRKQWPRLRLLSCCGVSWLASFAILYAVSLSTLTRNQGLESSWLRKGTFMPLPKSLGELGWFPKTYFSLFSNPGDLSFPIVAGLIFIVGCVALFGKRKVHLVMIVSPLLFGLLASALHEYPFGRRLLIFSVPLMLIVVAAGFEFAISAARSYSMLISLVLFEALLFQLVAGSGAIPSLNRSLFFAAVSLVVMATVFYSRDRVVLARTFGVLILVSLLLQPVGGATKELIHPSVRDDIRPVMAYVREHRQPNDIAYVYHHLRAAFQYYAPKYGFNANDYVLGTDEREHWKDQENAAYLEDLDRLRGAGRVWLVFSYVRTIKGVSEEDYLLHYLDRTGKRLDETRSAGASAYLYDLANRQAEKTPGGF